MSDLSQPGCPLVSIIIPVFNRAHCIARALDSIAAQQFDSIEILIGDDASTDDTIAVAREKSPGIRVASLDKNSGAAAARNAAVKLASGRFLAFLDSDDVWIPGKLRAQLDFLEKNPGVGVCACGHELVRLDGGTKEFPGRNPSDWTRSLAFAQSFHGASTPLIRREVWQETGPQDEGLRVLEDWDWMLRASRVTRLHVLAAPLARIHENRPSDPDFTVLSTRRFLEKHAAAFQHYGMKTHREIESQHWENAGRNNLLHRKFSAGSRHLLRSFFIAPWRNPKVLAALPLAALDSTLGTSLLRPCLRGR